MAQNIQVKTENEEGTLVIHTAVFRRLIEDCVAPYGNEIRVAKYKGDFPEWLQKVTGTSYLDALDFTETADGIGIRLILLLKEGLALSEIAKPLVASIKETIESRTGAPVSAVELVVSGRMTPKGTVAAGRESYRG